MTTWLDEMPSVAADLINEVGRQVTFKQVSAAASPTDKPWRGTGAAATSPVITAKAVAITSLKSLGEAFVKDVEKALFIASDADLSGYDLMIDDDGSEWKVRSTLELRPGTARIGTYVGVSR